MPVWQFNEIHSIEVPVTPERAFEAMKAVTADEIFLFRTLTWIRRAGRPVEECILNPGRTPLLEVVTRTGFLRLAEDAPREIVIGTILKQLSSGAIGLTADAFRGSVPAGTTLGTLNFLISPLRSSSLVTTETRVYANDTSARRQFALYWLAIRPGSAFLRRMWLRAIRKRALTAQL